MYRDAGSDLVHLYDYRTGEVKMLIDDDDLVEARWYPTMTTVVKSCRLGDGVPKRQLLILMAQHLF